ncbi:hypothetical protein MJC1_00527 [Methylocystis sp. MJC1]|jgi:hypothetical protein|nr:hypothetical protein MJC1_00527 [Methylocystis sp. MJC1]
MAASRPVLLAQGDAGSISDSRAPVSGIKAVSGLNSRPISQIYRVVLPVLSSFPKLISPVGPLVVA